MSFTDMNFDEFEVVNVNTRTYTKDDLYFLYTRRNGKVIPRSLVVATHVCKNWGAIIGDRANLISSKDKKTYGLKLSNTGLLTLGGNTETSVRINSVDLCVQLKALQVQGYGKDTDKFESWLMDDTLFFKPIFD